MKILFVVSNFKFGGMQKSLLNLTNELLKKNVEVHINVLSDKGELGAFIDPRIKITKENGIISNFVDSLYITKEEALKKNKKIFFIKLIYKLFNKFNKKEIFYKIITRNIEQNENYDIVISYTGMPGIWDYIVLNRYKSNKKIAWIHNWPDALNITYENDFSTYKKYQAIINVSKACKKRFDEIMPEINHKSYVIYNLFNEKEIVKKSNEENPYINDNGFKIVTVGRIALEQKRLDRIVDVIKLLDNDRHNNFKWYLVGDGPDKERLQHLIVENNIQDYVVFAGYQDNPYKYIKHADLFVLTSDFEGYGLVLLESRILNTVSITTNFECSNEVVIDGQTGIIVEKNSESIYNNIKKVLDDKLYYENIKNNLKKIKYSNEQSIKQFFEMIDNITKGE